MTENLKGISGSMFAGKTELLLKEISRTEMAGYKVHVFKPSIDTRWGLYEIHSHSGGSHAATPINHPYEIIEQLETDADLVAIDEIQFFEPEIIDAAIKPLTINKNNQVSTIATNFESENEKNNPNNVKVILDKNNFAIYFSRLPLPNSLKHIGLYVYKKNFLLKFAGMKQTPLELAEKLEQLERPEQLE